MRWPAGLALVEETVAVIMASSAYQPTTDWSKNSMPRNAIAPPNRPAPRLQTNREVSRSPALARRAFPMLRKDNAMTATNSKRPSRPPEMAEETYQLAVSHMSNPHSAFSLVPMSHHSSTRLIQLSTSENRCQLVEPPIIRKRCIRDQTGAFITTCNPTRVASAPHLIVRICRRNGHMQSAATPAKEAPTG